MYITLFNYASPLRKTVGTDMKRNNAPVTDQNIKLVLKKRKSEVYIFNYSVEES